MHLAPILKFVVIQKLLIDFLCQKFFERTYICLLFDEIVGNLTDIKRGMEEFCQNAVVLFVLMFCQVYRYPQPSVLYATHAVN